MNQTLNYITNIFDKANLSNNEGAVIMMRVNHLSLAEASAMMNVSRERVRQLELKAIKKLRGGE